MQQKFLLDLYLFCFVFLFHMMDEMEKKYLFIVDNFSLVMQVSLNETTAVANSEDESKPVVEEVSSSDHNEPTITLGETLSMKQINSTAVASVQEMQNLADGTDIKVGWYSYCSLPANTNLHFLSPKILHVYCFQFPSFYQIHMCYANFLV